MDKKAAEKDSKKPTDRKEIQRIISLTFDENPDVRKQAATQLSQTEDPAATFALLELSYDKDEGVKEFARSLLSNKGPAQEMEGGMSFAELFAKGAEKEEQQSQIQNAQPHELTQDELVKKKVLYPVEKLFGKKMSTGDAARVKDKMMPAIENLYSKFVNSKSDKGQKSEQHFQKMLTSYIDMLSGINLSGQQKPSVPRIDAQIPGVVVQQASASHNDNIEAHPPDDTHGLDVVGTGSDPSKISGDLAALERELDSHDEKKPSQEKPASQSSDVPQDEDGPIAPHPGSDRSIFRKAYDVMMASDGDEDVMTQQSEKLIKGLKDEIDLAFKLAKQRFKSDNITHLSEIRDGMKNLNTDVLLVKSVDIVEYPKTKTRKENLTKIVVSDDVGGEGIIYLFEGRGSEVKPGMKVKLVKGQVKSFEFSNDTAMTVGKKGNVYIVL